MLTNEQTKILAGACVAVYEFGTSELDPPGCSLVKEFGKKNNDPTGFHAKIYQNSDTCEYIVAIAATNSYLDVLADINGGRPQYESDEGGQALKRWIDSEIPPNSSIQITGHSLGGTLAQYLAYDLAANEERDGHLSLVTFNAAGGELGARQMAADNRESYDPNRLENVNVANYWNKRDRACLLGNGHLGGNTYRMDFDSPSALSAHDIAPFTRSSTDLSTATPCTPDYLSIDSFQGTAALISITLMEWDLNGHISEEEALAITLAAVTIALMVSPPSERNQIIWTFVPDVYREYPWDLIADIAIGLRLDAFKAGLGSAAALIACAVISDDIRQTINTVSNLSAEALQTFVNTANQVEAASRIAYANVVAICSASTIDSIVSDIIFSISDLRGSQEIGIIDKNFESLNYDIANIFAKFRLNFECELGNLSDDIGSIDQAIDDEWNKFESTVTSLINGNDIEYAANVVANEIENAGGKAVDFIADTARNIGEDVKNFFSNSNKCWHF